MSGTLKHTGKSWRPTLAAILIVGILGCASDEIIEPEDLTNYIFDDTVIRDYHLTVDPLDWEWLNRNARLEQYIPADLTFEGEEFQRVAIRFKGSVGTLFACVRPDGTRICKKLSIKVKFNHYDSEGRFYDLKTLNLHSMERDKAKMRDAIAYELFRNVGVYASRTAYARVFVNGELQGLFVIVEQVDGRFSRRRFPDGGEGNIYKQVWPKFAHEAPYLRQLESNRDELPTADKMIRFAADLGSMTDATYLDVMERWTDTDMLMKYMAVDRLVENWDGILAWYCGTSDCNPHNFYWYESTVDDKVWLVPWDMDNTFNYPGPFRGAFGMPDWEVQYGCELVPRGNGKFVQHPSCDPLIGGMGRVMWDRYAEASRDVLDNHYQLDALYARMDEIAALIGDAVAEDPNSITYDEWQNAMATLRNNMSTLRNYIDGRVNP